MLGFELIILEYWLVSNTIELQSMYKMYKYEIYSNNIS